MVVGMTKKEFETSYAVRAGLLVPQLRLLGLQAVPCHCGEPDCPGWQMVSVAESMQARRVLFVDRANRPYEDREKC